MVNLPKPRRQESLKREVKFGGKKGISKVAGIPRIKTVYIENSFECYRVKPIYNCNIKMKFRLRLSRICPLHSFLHFPLKHKVGKNSWIRLFNPVCKCFYLYFVTIGFPNWVIFVTT